MVRLSSVSPCFVVSRMQLTHIDAMKEITVKFHFDKKLCLRSTAMKLLVYSTSFLNLFSIYQRLFFLRRLRKFGTSPRILRSFYTCTVESILTGCIAAWFGNSTAGNRRALQRVVWTARHIVGGELPSLQDIYTRRCTRKARRIIKDSSHPSHRLLSLLPSGRRFRSIRSRTSRLRDSFFPQAIRLMNSQKWPTLQHTPTHTTCHALHFNTFYRTTRTHLLSLETIQCTSTTLHMNNLLHLCTTICCSTNLLLIYNLLHLHIITMYRLHNV